MYNDEGKNILAIGANDNGNGSIATLNQTTGKTSVFLSDTPGGGTIQVFNKTGEIIITLEADDYGNGEVGAWNRKGKGRVWDSQ